MSEKGPNRTDINGILQGLRREFARQAEQAGTIEAIAGGPVDRDLPLDYWRFSDDRSGKRAVEPNPRPGPGHA